MKILHVLFFTLFTINQIDSYSISPPEIINIRQKPDSVGVYEKFEVSLELKCEFVNPKTDVAGDNITLSSIKNGKYKLKIFHTWRGEFIDEKEITCTNESLTFSVPFMRITGSHANYIGQDIAFILKRLPEPSPLQAKPKGRILAN
jgi:hypothetical protein